MFFWVEKNISSVHHDQQPEHAARAIGIVAGKGSKF